MVVHKGQSYQNGMNHCRGTPQLKRIFHGFHKISRALFTLPTDGDAKKSPFSELCLTDAWQGGARAPTETRNSAIQHTMTWPLKISFVTR